jgi:DNA-3-methyladenine glycosylase I
MSEPASLITHADGKTRCWWPGVDPLYVAYHDTDWGVPETDDRALFEKLVLDGFQAGLSWITILRRRENFRKAFKNFEIAKVARMSDKDVEKLMGNEGIIRNRAKISSTIANAKLTLKLEGSLSEIIWAHAPKVRTKRVSAENFEFVATTPESEALSRTLRKLGFSFVGPTTMYALMQSIGMVNDHAPGCFRRNQLSD